MASGAKLGGMLVRDEIVKSALDLIGGTPLVELTRVARPDSGRILAKLESCNPGGSIKDRVALAMVEDAEQRGVIAPGGTFVEPTSGNTGIGLAMVAAVKGYHLVLTMPEDMSIERRMLLSLYGAEVVLTPAIRGMDGAVETAERLAREKGYVMLQQFNNPANPAAHRHTTAMEILRQTQGNIDAFVAAVGTGGTLTGVAEVLKEKIPDLQVIAVEPARSAVLEGKPRGPHRIQGIGAGFVPAVLNRDIYDQVIGISDEEAYESMRQIISREGLLVGISAGANYAASAKIAQRLGPDKTIVTVFPDTGERYLSLIQSFK
jgi:cysteine synthase A